MKFLTIRQPWASLISLGVKRIETRSWSTSFRGPLAIHAGKAKPSRDLVRMGQWLTRWDYGEGRYAMSDGLGKWVALPLGAVVAVCDLIDVVPIVDDPHACNCLDVRVGHPEAGMAVRLDGPLVDPTYPPTYEPERITDVADQLPFGDFTPGRYAWLLDNVRPLDHPVPMKGAQGLRDVDNEMAAAITRALTEGDTP